MAPYPHKVLAVDMIGIRYNAKLQVLVRQIKKDIDATLMTLVRSLAPQYVQDSAPAMPYAPITTMDAWSDTILAAMRFLFDRWRADRVAPGAQRIAQDFVRAAVRRSERDMKRSVGIDVFSESQQMRDYLTAATQQNVQLIQSIPQRYLEEVQTLILANMRSGMRPGYIERALQEQFGVTSRRAKFIARDQTGKIQGEIAQRQQQDNGFEYFQWVDSHDQRVRHRHREIANKTTAYGPGVYKWSNLPLSQTGEPIRPGQDYNCRCIAIPVSSRKVEQYRKNGHTQSGVYR